MLPDLLALSIPLVALLIPVIAILTHHQRKMAEVIHNSNARASIPTPEVEALRREVQELKALVHQQAIALDTLVNRTGDASGEITQRIQS